MTDSAIATFTATTTELQVDHLAELPVDLGELVDATTATAPRLRPATLVQLEIDRQFKVARSQRQRRLDRLAAAPPPAPPPPARRSQHSASQAPLVAATGRRALPLAPSFGGQVANPRPAAELMTCERVEARGGRLLCIGRDHCLTVASRLNWRGLDCSACAVVVDIGPARWRQDVVELAAFGLALARDRGSLDAPIAPIAPTPARPAKVAIKPRPAKVEGTTRHVVGDGRAKGPKPCEP